MDKYLTKFIVWFRIKWKVGKIKKQNIFKIKYKGVFFELILFDENF